VKEQLFDIAATDMTPVFVRRFIELMPWVYKEAKYKAFNDPDFGGSEARFLLPNFRRALTEVALRRAANDAGLIYAIEKTASGAHEYTTIQAGRISLTASYVDSCRGMPRPAKHRSQYSEINDHLKQLPLQPVTEDSSPSAGDIYAIILHGSAPDSDETPGFIKLGFPGQSCKSWVEDFDLYSVMEEQGIRYRKPEDDLQAQNQEVVPTLKQHVKAERKE